MRDPKFLSSILPLSPELDSILRRIFECDPRRRISITELRELIIKCPRFTSCTAAMPPTLPPTPPPECIYKQDVSLKSDCQAGLVFQQQQQQQQQPPPPPPLQHPAAPYTPASSPPLHLVTTQHSELMLSSNGSSSSDEGSVFSDASSGSGAYDDNTKAAEPIYVPSQPSNFYGSFIALDPLPKSALQQPNFQSVQVC